MTSLWLFLHIDAAVCVWMDRATSHGAVWTTISVNGSEYSVMVCMIMAQTQDNKQ